MIQKLTRKDSEFADMEIQDIINADWCEEQLLLHIAVMENNMNLITQCFHFGVDVNKVDNKGRTALYYCESVEIAKLLVEHGIDVNNLDFMGITAVVDHYSRSNDAVVKYLIQITDLDLAGDNFLASTLLEYMIYSEERDLSLIKMVVDRTKDLNRINYSGYTYLLMAVRIKKNTGVILLLIEAGVDLYVRDQDGNNFYDLSFKYVQAEIQKRYPEFIKRKDMTYQQRKRLDKLTHLKSLELKCNISN